MDVFIEQRNAKIWTGINSLLKIIALAMLIIKENYEKWL
jgi:hypothetical protein